MGTNRRDLLGLAGAGIAASVLGGGLAATVVAGRASAKPVMQAGTLYVGIRLEANGNGLDTQIVGVFQSLETAKKALWNELFSRSLQGWDEDCEQGHMTPDECAVWKARLVFDAHWDNEGTNLHTLFAPHGPDSTYVEILETSLITG